MLLVVWIMRFRALAHSTLSELLGTVLCRSLKCLQSQLAPVSACARALSRSTALHQQPQPATLSALPNHVRAYVEEKQRLCQPSAVHICDGSEAENNYLLDLMLKAGSIVPLPKYRNWCVQYIRSAGSACKIFFCRIGVLPVHLFLLENCNNSWVGTNVYA